jgi:AraC family transcriptional regulator
VAFLPPTCSVRLHPLDRPFRVLNCIFEKSFFEDTTEIEPEQWAEHTDALLAVRNKRLEAMMQQIYAELVEPGFASDLLIEAASTMILVEMGRHGRERLASANAEGSTVRGLAPWQLRRIRERVEGSLEMGYPSLAELSRLCGISQSHLMRTFKASTGWQIHKYIAEERLKAAKAMLAKDQLGLKEVSARLGFCSPAYFATAFRRMTGMTPTEYRRRAGVEDLGEA